MMGAASGKCIIPPCCRLQRFLKLLIYREFKAGLEFKAGSLLRTSVVHKAMGGVPSP